MDAPTKLYWKLCFDKASTEGVIRDSHNPLWDYEDELIDGPVIDIGCGQSDILLGLAATDRNLLGLDAEPLQLQWLRQLALAQPGTNLENWRFIRGFFPATPLPESKYALVAFSNLLHFYPLAECVTIVADLEPYLVKGSLVYVKVHSHNHLLNKAGNSQSHDYFKHYFTTQDFSELFPPEKFERMYIAEIDKIYNKADKKFAGQWVKEWCYQVGEYDDEIIQQHIQEQLAESSHTDITAIFRRR